MAGVALFDFALVAYPLYQTSLHVLHGLHEDNISLSDAQRWLYFWLTYGTVKIVEGVGGDSVPGFHFAKAAILLSLYSIEHSVVVANILPKACEGFVTSADKARQWWSETAVPEVEARTGVGSYIISAWTRVVGK